MLETFNCQSDIFVNVKDVTEVSTIIDTCGIGGVYKQYHHIY
jgi:hypothetical protein